MKTIPIADDLYALLVQSAVDFNESPSSILRRMLGLDHPKEGIATLPTLGLSEASKSEVAIHLNSMEFRCARGAVGRFLSVLGLIYHAHADNFHKVENIKGRGRLYFSRDVNVLTQAGRSVNPKQIPNSPYWVITTTPTDLKQETLTTVMKAFDYPSSDVGAAVAAIAD